MSEVWKGFKRLTSVEKASESFVESLHIQPTVSEVIDLERAYGRVLAESITSPVDIPPFNRAAMDGYALRAGDTFGASSTPVLLKVVGEVRPGQRPVIAIGPGEAIRIQTGGEMPQGADAVVEVERTREEGEYVEISVQVAPFRNVSKVGEDVKANEVVLAGGTVIGPFEIGLLSEMNMKQVEVTKKPMVTMISTGRELIEVGDELRGGSIVNSIRWMVRAMVEEVGGSFSYAGLAGDDPTELARIMDESLTSTDVMLTSGGTSVGETDVVKRALEEVGARIIAHGLNVMPGKPTLLAFLSNKKPFIGLPGYPVSAAIASRLFVVPILERLLGIGGRRQEPLVRAKLKRKVPSKPGTVHFVRVHLERSEGRWMATPIRVTGAGIMSSLVKADGLLVVPADLEGYDKGEPVDVVVIKKYLPSPK